MIRRLPVVLLTLGWLAAGCASQGPSDAVAPFEPQTLHPEGVYTHAYTGLEFPEWVDQFQRSYVTQYDPDAANVSGHYFGPAAMPGVATVYHYPANETASRPTPDEFLAHFEEIGVDVMRASSGAEFIGSSEYEAQINGFDLVGVHARFTIRDHPVFNGDVDSHLYLFALDGWYLKFRFTHPASVAETLIPREQRFLAATRWPLPES